MFGPTNIKKISRDSSFYIGEKNMNINQSYMYLIKSKR